MQSENIMYKILVTRILAPALDLIKGTNIVEYLQILERTQWLKQKEIIEFATKKLRRLLTFAYERCPYYHHVFKDLGLKPDNIKTVKDLVKLPILTKEDVRNNLAKMIARSFQRSRLIPERTGGSTGEPLDFFTTKESWSWEHAAGFRAYGWSGYQLGDKQALMWGHPVDLVEFQKLRENIVNFFQRTIVLPCDYVSDKSMTIFANRLERFRPKLIRGYASAVYLFAKFCKERGHNIQPKAVITTADTLFDHERRMIEDTFKCEVYDFYGSREAAGIASECPEHSGYHVSAENIILEIIRKGEHVAPGENGEILVTNLNNYGMPFIRYGTKDVGSPSDEICPCGRGLPLIKSLEGRNWDIITTPNGYIQYSFFYWIIAGLHVKQFQIIQETRDRILIKIVKDKQYSEVDTEYILQKLSHSISKNIKIDIEFVNLIPPTKSGKRRVVISNIPAKLA